MLLKVRFEFIRILAFVVLTHLVAVDFVVVAFFVTTFLFLLQESEELLAVAYVLLDVVLVPGVLAVREEMAVHAVVVTVRLFTLNSNFALFMGKDRNKRFVHSFRISVPPVTLQQGLLLSLLLLP
jgi:hypothetical protein